MDAATWLLEPFLLKLSGPQLDAVEVYRGWAVQGGIMSDSYNRVEEEERKTMVTTTF